MAALPERPRGYNSDYLELCTHYDLTPLTINVGCLHEQGDVESGNRHLKRRLGQHLLLRGSREFASVEEYNRLVVGVLRAANAPRQPRLVEELAVMRPLPAGRLAEYREYAPVVSSQSLIRVKGHAHSGPSRLIGHTLRVELHEAVLKVYLGREFLLELPRLRGARRTQVDFRHLITALRRRATAPSSTTGIGKRCIRVRCFGRPMTGWWPTTGSGLASLSICKCSSWRRRKRWQRSSRCCKRN